MFDRNSGHLPGREKRKEKTGNIVVLGIESQ